MGSKSVKRLRSVLGIGGLVIVVAGLSGAGWMAHNVYAYDVGVAKARWSGYVEKQTTVNGTMINYSEGPANGEPPLLLIHGQGVNWQSYYPVLRQLARHFHVYAVDVYGHGRSARVPAKYTAKAIGGDLGSFVEQVIGQPVIVSGHSSGGQLAAWLGGHRPDLVRGVVLEDPPMFTTLLPRAQTTWNWVDLATACHEYLASGTSQDWPTHYFRHQRMWQFFGDGAPKIIAWALKRHRGHPDKPITLPFLPPSYNDLQRGLQDYDPRFGEAFYTGSWDVGFDHGGTLTAIKAPTVLLKANATYGPDGILQGAMDDHDAQRVMSLLRDGGLVSVDSGHNVHGEKPAEFVKALLQMKNRLQ